MLWTVVERSKREVASFVSGKIRVTSVTSLLFSSPSLELAWSQRRATCPNPCNDENSGASLDFVSLFG